MTRSYKGVAIRDSDVRLALRSRLHAQHAGDAETRIVEELGLCQGRARIDVAVINGLFAGYEIKSQQDTLERLPGQIDAYSCILDEVTVVASECHASAVKKLVPPWWGITIACLQGETLAFEQQRSPVQNPAPDRQALVQLLWRSEAMQVVEAFQLAEGLDRKPRRFVWARLADELPWETLHQAVREKLKSREGWRAVAP
jgi:hypothetical protein